MLTAEKTKTKRKRLILISSCVRQRGWGARSSTPVEYLVERGPQEGTYLNATTQGVKQALKKLKAKRRRQNIKVDQVATTALSHWYDVR